MIRTVAAIIVIILTIILTVALTVVLAIVLTVILTIVLAIVLAIVLTCSLDDKSTHFIPYNQQICRFFVSAHMLSGLIDGSTASRRDEPCALPGLQRHRAMRQRSRCP